MTQTGPIRVNPETLLEVLGKKNSLLYGMLLNLLRLSSYSEDHLPENEAKPEEKNCTRREKQILGKEIFFYYVVSQNIVHHKFLIWSSTIH